MVLVTGASGMIGRAVAGALRGARLPSRAQLDLETAKPNAYDEAVRGCDAVVHCAALVHRPSAPRDRYERVNVEATRLLAAAARRQGVGSFVLLSTIGVYGPGPFVDAREDAVLQPGTPYALSKQRAEEVVRESGIERRIVLRPALVFGEGDRGNVLALMRLIDRGLYRHIGGNTAAKSLICASDLAAVVRMCLEKLPPGGHLFNVASAQPISVAALADSIAACLGRAAPASLPGAVIKAAATLLGRREAARSLSTTTTCSIDRLVGAIGSSPATPLDDALAEEIRWARAQGLLRGGRSR